MTMLTIEDILTKDNAVLGLKAITTLATGSFFGAASYVSFVECPARINQPNEIAIMDHFLQTFPRAMAYQKTLAQVSIFGGLGVFFLDRKADQSKFFLVGGIVMGAILPWTYGVIMPLNRQLMDEETAKKKGEVWIRNSMDEWDRIHFVRTLLSGTAFLIFSYSWFRLAA